MAAKVGANLLLQGTGGAREGNDEGFFSLKSDSLPFFPSTVTKAMSGTQRPMPLATASIGLGPCFHEKRRAPRRR